MPTTRSATKQVKLDDFRDQNDEVKPNQKVAEQSKADAIKAQRKTATKPKSQTTKRAAPHHDAESAVKASSQNKKPKLETSKAREEFGLTKDHESSSHSTNFKKQRQLGSESIDELEQPIIINRSPVLQLWGAAVAQFLHPDLSWPASLSAGSAISSLCAVTKGQSIGMINPKDDKGNEEQQKKKQEAKKGTTRVEVMGFPLFLKSDKVVIGGQAKSLNEGALRSKFGEHQYLSTKDAMVNALRTWSDKKDELNRKAFHMYEKFRPEVASGQSGWGRKGELNLHKVASTIKR